MKSKILLLALIVLMSGAYAQQKKFKFVKLKRDVKKEAKRYEKEGWKVFPGSLPIGQQLNKAFDMQAETDKDGFPKWIVANGSSVAQTEAAADMQSTELAKNRLVGLIETHMKAVIESDVANNQIDKKDAATVTQTIEVSANKVSKKLGLVQPMFKVYREVNKNTEVQIMIGYSYEQAQNQIIDEMKVELKDKAQDIRQKYDKFLNPDKYKQGEIKNDTEEEK